MEPDDATVYSVGTRGCRPATGGSFRQSDLNHQVIQAEVDVHMADYTRPALEYLGPMTALAERCHCGDTKSAGVQCSTQQPVDVELLPAAKLRGRIFGAFF